jgi:hypothetical protein
LCFCAPDVTNVHELQTQHRGKARKSSTHLGGVHNPKIIDPKKIEAVQTFRLHVAPLTYVGKLRPGGSKL